MAVTDHTSIKAMLALATTSLLGNAATAQSFANDWKTNITYLDYRERDRVTVQSYIANIRGQLSDDVIIQVGVALDTMSGATPTGAIDGSSVVTSTGTSGGGFDVSGQGTAYAQFNDTRLSVDANWEHTYTRNFRLAYGGYASVESDFTAIGGSLKASLDLNNRQTTLSVGGGFEGDKNAKRDGFTPEPLSNVEDAIFYEAGRRNTFSSLVGITQVVNRTTVAQVNLTYTHSLGYHTDPYKVFSQANEGVEQERYYEGRPDERRRTALYGSLKQRRDSGDIIGGSARLYYDDWGIYSFTLDSSYRYMLESGRGRYLEPFGRIYAQTAADFYLQSLTPGTDMPQYASADSRLGQMQSYSAGIRFNVPIADWGYLLPRISYYHQEFQDATHERNQAVIISVGLENR